MNRLAAACCLALAACSQPVQPRAISTAPVRIRYHVAGTEGASQASVTYLSSVGGMSQLADVSIPWTEIIDVPHGTILSLSAQNTGSRGCVRVEIIHDVKTLESGFSCGAYVVAMASTLAP